MTRKNGVFNKRCALIFVVVIILATIIEVCFNFNIHNAVKDYDISSAVNIYNISGETSKSQLLHVTCEDKRYITRIYLEGYVSRDTQFNLQVRTVNSFGKEEVKTIREPFLVGTQGIYFPVNSHVAEYNITVNSRAGNYYIRNSYEQNHFDINWYRFALFSLSMFLIGILFFGAIDLQKNIVVFFVIASLGFGSIMILASGPKYSTWDEQAHFNQVYQMANQDGRWTVASWNVYQRNILSFDTREGKAFTEERLNKQDNEYKLTLDRNYNTVQLTKLAYLHQAVAFKIGNLLHMNFVQKFALVKFVSLFVYTFVIALAISISCKRKIFIATMSLLPTILFQGCTLTYDGFIYALITLGIVLIVNEIENANKNLNKNYILWGIMLIILGSASKAIYIPLILFLFLIPKDKFANRKTQYFFYFCVLCVLGIVMSTFVLPTLTNTIAGNTSYGGDYRGGETGSVKQLISMVKHPLATVKLYFKNIFAFNNFRNMGTDAYDNYTFLNMMFLNFGKYGVIDDKWGMVLIPLLFFLFLYDDGNQMKNSFNKFQRIGTGLIVFIVVGLIWSAMYLSFTTIGNETILGVQARYYLPLMLPTSYILSTKRIKLDIKTGTLWRIFLGIAVFFECHLIYNLILLENVL